MKLKLIGNGADVEKSKASLSWGCCKKLSTALRQKQKDGFRSYSLEQIETTKAINHNHKSSEMP